MLLRFSLEQTYYFLFMRTLVSFIMFCSLILSTITNCTQRLLIVYLINDWLASGGSLKGGDVLINYLRSWRTSCKYPSHGKQARVAKELRMHSSTKNKNSRNRIKKQETLATYVLQCTRPYLKIRVNIDEYIQLTNNISRKSTIIE